MQRNIPSWRCAPLHSITTKANNKHFELLRIKLSWMICICISNQTVFERARPFYIAAAWWVESPNDKVCVLKIATKGICE